MKDPVAYFREMHTHSAEEPAHPKRAAKTTPDATPLDIAKEVQATLDALLPFIGNTHLRDLWHANDLMLELVERLEDQR